VATAFGTLETPSTGVWPLEPRPEVVSGFDPPLSTYGSGHRGVDLAGTVGQEVRAAAGGRVTYAGSLAGRGVVVVTHGTTRTTYEPVEAGVERGSIVTAGAVIGTLQTFGSHCAPQVCLHWGLLEGETYLDPLTLVGAGPVRLLPILGTLPTADPGRGTHVGQGTASPSARGALARLIGSRSGPPAAGTDARPAHGRVIQ
jgi:murein DD-endopeptidase MepM/ murein hydrolase activator NlpD